MGYCMADSNTHWHSICLQRNCSASPRLLIAVLASASAFSLIIGFVFGLMNAPWVFLFSCIEVLAVVVAFIVHARSATDSDTIGLSEFGLEIRQVCMGRMHVTRFNRSFVRVAMTDEPDPKIVISSSGQRVVLGHGQRLAARKALCILLQKELPGKAVQEGVQRMYDAMTQAGARVMLLMPVQGSAI